MKEKSILVFCAHNDDQLLGLGGTIRKYVDEGIKVYSIIFSYGELSLPHMKGEHVAQTRAKEAAEAGKILGEQFYLLGYPESKLYEVADRKLLASFIETHKPFQIFTHSVDDTHPDHQAVLRVTCEVLEQTKYKGDVFMYDIWNVFTFKSRDYPKKFVDITETFKTKIKAFKEHRSQWATAVLLTWNIYLKALYFGWRNNCRYAELFHVLDKKTIKEYTNKKWTKNKRKK